ncbi:MAG: ATP-binding protein, partial [Roseiflexaceae bacterium]
DEAGRTIAFQAFGEDITDQRKLEEQFLQSQKMEAIGRLAGGIAHDFNNILVPIIGYTELGMMELSPDDKVYADLQRVREAAERAADLTRQILAFSRKQVLEMRTIDLNALVMDFQRMMQRLIGEDIEVHTFLDPALYQVKADKGQIEQVLLNLVVNARDAMLQGGKLTLETDNVYLDDAYLTKYADAQASGHYVMLAVSDTGQGMDAETQQHIFEPFFTTKEQGKGTGLGLATVFGIVKQHGGNMWVYSELGKGTTFKMYLPQAEKTMPFAPGERTTPASVHGTETVLVVEDEDMVRELVGETLEAHGYKVIEAPGPEAGLQIAAGYQDIIHLLLTDVIMPEMNGRELYQKLAAIRSDIKVLYMSGYMDHAIVHHGILDEGVNFLQKPFTVQSLTRKVRQVLN